MDYGNVAECRAFDGLNKEDTRFGQNFEWSDYWLKVLELRLCSQKSPLNVQVWSNFQTYCHLLLPNFTGFQQPLFWRNFGIFLSIHTFFTQDTEWQRLVDLLSKSMQQIWKWQSLEAQKKYSYCLGSVSSHTV